MPLRTEPASAARTPKNIGIRRRISVQQTLNAPFVFLWELWPLSPFGAQRCVSRGRWSRPLSSAVETSAMFLIVPQTGYNRWMKQKPNDNFLASFRCDLLIPTRGNVKKKRNNWVSSDLQTYKKPLQLFLSLQTTQDWKNDLKYSQRLKQFLKKSSITFPLVDVHHSTPASSAELQPLQKVIYATKGWSWKEFWKKYGSISSWTPAHGSEGRNLAKNAAKTCGKTQPTAFPVRSWGLSIVRHF